MNRKSNPSPHNPPDRITDVFRAPPLPPVPDQHAATPLPESWRTIIDTASEWPYVDPDKAMTDITERVKTEVLEYKDYSQRDIDPLDEPEFSESTPWGKMGGETGREYELFCYFRSLGMARRKADVARHYDVTTAYVSSVVKKNNWDDRILAWDRYVEGEYTREVLLRVRGMAGEHAQIARMGVQALATVFEAVINRMDEDPDKFQDEINDLPLKQLFALAHRSAQVLPNLMNAERLSMGMPTEISQQLNTEERIVKIQTSEELAEIVHALTGVLSGNTGDNADGNGDGESTARIGIEAGDPEPDSFDDGWGEAEIIQDVNPEDE